MGQSQTSHFVLEDNAGGFGFTRDGTFRVLDQQSDISEQKSTSAHQTFRHPWAVTFHLMFKIIAIFIYLFVPPFLNEFLGVFVILVFLVSIDFWLVKNITGRLLVGLRWWNYIDDDGQSHWIFENRRSSCLNNKKPDQNQFSSTNNDVEFIFSNNPNQTQQSSSIIPQTNQHFGGFDSTVFWVSQFLFIIFWFLSLLSAIFSFKIHWVLLIAIALVLNGSNLYGYIRCRFGNFFGNNSNNYSQYSSVLSKYVGPKLLFNVMRNATSTANPNANTP